jgi:hypothetical protein
MNMEHVWNRNLQWAGLENAVFRAVDLVAFVRNVVLRIVGQSMAMQRLGGRLAHKHIGSPL